MQTQAPYLRNSIKILYEDPGYVVFEKPAGLLVIPTEAQELNTLVNIVNYQYATGKEAKLHPCHRLDKETSGVILFAKGKGHQQKMMEEFKAHRVKKHYIAFIQGRLKQSAGQLRSVIRDLDQKKFQKHSAAKFSITNYKVLDVKKLFTVVDVEPITGRTNQIRIQFAQIGNPLVGDRKYSIAKNYPLKFRRTALHAAQLQWINPETNKTITVQSDLPKDMEEFLAKHRN